MKPNLKSLIALVGALCALWLTSAQAEDRTTNIISGTVWDNANANYAVGQTGTNNYLEINSSGVLTNVSEVFIGSNSTATANSVLITGTSSSLYATGRVMVGNNGSGNSLTIAAGGMVTNGGANTMIGASGANNSALVTGGSSLWRVISSDFRVGGNGANNKLTITNGGVVRCTTSQSYIAVGGVNNNAALVTGAGSLWQNSGELRVGNSGSLNSLTVKDGGTVTNTVGYIGNTANYSYNTAYVSDPNSVWQNTTLSVGAAGKNNTLTITNGGKVVCVATSGANAIGNGASASNNTAVVTGPGSSWVTGNGAYMAIGNNAGGFNSLIITNGGTVTNTTTYISQNASSINNSALVTGTGSVLANYGIFLGNNGSGNSLTIADGGLAALTGGLTIGNGTGGNNSALITGAGSTLNASSSANGNLNMGFSSGSANNSLTVAAGGTLINASFGNLGYAAGNSNNTVLVTGAGSTWQCGNNVFIGTNGSANSLTISAGGKVFNSAGNIGFNASSVNNTVLVTGNNSAWLNRGALVVGNSGAGNSLVIADGGLVTNTAPRIGSSAAANNSVLVTDPGSLWQTSGDVLLGGTGGSFNSLIVSNGAVAGFTVGTGFYVSASAGSSNNTVLVTGSGSILKSTGSQFKLGNNGTGNNSLTVSVGGTVSNSTTMVVGSVAGCNSNTVTITGAGSTLNLVSNILAFANNAATTNNVLNVGNGGLLTNITTLSLWGVNSVFNLGDGTTLAQVVANEVKFNASTARLNFNAGRLIANGGQTYVINGSGSIYVQSGGAEIDTQGYDLIIGNPFLEDGTSPGGGFTKLGAGKLTLLTGGGGSPYTGGTIVSNGTLVVDGNLGTGAVAVRSGATLGGTATFKGPVTVEAGATLQPGNGGLNSSKLTISNTLDLASTATTLIAINRTNAQNASTLVVSGAVALGGTLTVTNVGEPLQGNDSFTLFDFSAAPGGSFSLTNLPPLSGNQNWWVTNSGATLVVNTAPEAGTNSYNRSGLADWTILISDLLTNATDVDGHLLTLAGTGTSTNGITLANDGTFLHYTNASLVDDEFTYTVTDSFGGTNSAVITLIAGSSVPGTSLIGSIASGNPTTLTATGIAGYTYVTERATNLDQVVWDAIATNVLTGTNTVISVTDSNPPLPSAFYRMMWQQP